LSIIFREPATYKHCREHVQRLQLDQCRGHAVDAQGV